MEPGQPPSSRSRPQATAASAAAPPAHLPAINTSAPTCHPLTHSHPTPAPMGVPVRPTRAPPAWYPAPPAPAPQPPRFNVPPHAMLHHGVHPGAPGAGLVLMPGSYGHQPVPYSYPVPQYLPTPSPGTIPYATAAAYHNWYAHSRAGMAASSPVGTPAIAGPSQAGPTAGVHGATRSGPAPALPARGPSHRQEALPRPQVGMPQHVGGAGLVRGGVMLPRPDVDECLGPRPWELDMDECLTRIRIRLARFPWLHELTRDSHQVRRLVEQADRYQERIRLGNRQLGGALMCPCCLNVRVVDTGLWSIMLTRVSVQTKTDKKSEHKYFGMWHGATTPVCKSEYRARPCYVCRYSSGAVDCDRQVPRHDGSVKRQKKCLGEL